MEEEEGRGGDDDREDACNWSGCRLVRRRALEDDCVASASSEQARRATHGRSLPTTDHVADALKAQLTDPAPSREAGLAVHQLDQPSEQAAEGACRRSRREEDLTVSLSPSRIARTAMRKLTSCYEISGDTPTPTHASVPLAYKKCHPGTRQAHPRHEERTPGTIRPLFDVSSCGNRCDAPATPRKTRVEKSPAKSTRVSRARRRWSTYFAQCQ